MAQENRISFTLSTEDFSEIEAAIKMLQNKLLPHLSTLSSDDRASLIKMGNKNAAFVRKCTEYMEQNPTLAPQYINLKEMNIDLEAVETLRKLLIPIEQISSAIDDSMMLSGSEAYVAALAFYHNVKGATRMNIPGAKNIAEELRKQFIKRSQNGKNNQEDKH